MAADGVRATIGDALMTQLAAHADRRATSGGHMRAISLHQPWASLLVTRQPCEHCGNSGPDGWGGPQAVGEYPGCCGAHRRSMVKRLETRSWPCPPKIIGQRVAFHAAKREPPVGALVGDYSCYWSAGRRKGELRIDGPGIEAPCPLPLGAIVGSGVFVASLSIGDCGDFADNIEHVCRDGNELLHHLPLSGDLFDVTEFDISDHLPYGDFTPGRDAWLIENAAPTTERCPWCWRQGFVDGVSYPTDYGTGIEYDATPCPLCSDGTETGTGHCDPIPAKGGQRFWEWSPR